MVSHRDGIITAYGVGTIGTTYPKRVRNSGILILIKQDTIILISSLLRPEGFDLCIRSSLSAYAVCRLVDPNLVNGLFAYGDSWRFMSGDDIPQMYCVVLPGDGDIQQFGNGGNRKISIASASLVSVDNGCRYFAVRVVDYPLSLLGKDCTVEL